AGVAVTAVATATFHRAKPGVGSHRGKGHAGEVAVVDVGVPRPAPLEPWARLIAPSVLRTIPPRDAASTKFTSGTVTVVGGSRGITGAPI
ncbi:hypothetical protein OFM21_29850, partial [Escherichia coli]|nr:hypothetical protein [Escherichia coli]